jgi:hypothetical protein
MSMLTLTSKAMLSVQAFLMQFSQLLSSAHIKECDSLEFCRQITGLGGQVSTQINVSNLPRDYSWFLLKKTIRTEDD